MEKGKLAVLGITVLFFAGIIYYFFTPGTTTKEIPSYVSADDRALYEWARMPEGAALLEQIPCYCGCKYEGHEHTRHCFWRDDGTFDKHGITCSVCKDIATMTRQMHEEGKDICTIRKTIDEFYEPNKHLGTDTPMPEGCT
ncbi:MAG: hypothetical protein HY366_00945 [Candidatus Aenigmarchaeota archaeon]|nr:hypothetical protein [Candidatus Aenigmarchaeota archaeon]